MGKRLKLGIVGTGVAARKLYLPVWSKLKHKIDLVACTNRTREKAEEYAGLCGIPKVAGSASALIRLPEVEAVLISLPIHAQPSIVLEALRAKKAVISEKPVAPSFASGKRLVKEAARYSTPWLVAENFRFMPHVGRLRRWIENGRLGEVRLFQAAQIVSMDAKNPFFHTAWRQQPKHVGAYVTDAGVHLADVLLHCLGPVSRVQGFTATLTDLPPPDTAVGAIELESGVLGTWSSCFSARHEGPMLRVLGSRGRAELFSDRVELYGKKGRKTVFQSDVNSFEAQFSHFADVVKKGAPPQVTPEQALGDLALVERLVRGR